MPIIVRKQQMAVSFPKEKALKLGPVERFAILLPKQSTSSSLVLFLMIWGAFGPTNSTIMSHIP